MKQVCIIHGGSTFENYEDYLRDLTDSNPKYERLLYGPDWKPSLAVELQKLGYDVLMPQMPCKQNAQYDEWAITFSKIVPFLEHSAVLVGHSLGGIFLAKYLNEHPDLHFAKLILVAAPFDDESDEPLASFKLHGELLGLGRTADVIHLFHSTDDPIVAASELDKFKTRLPHAQVHLLNDRSHFFSPDFPELQSVITG